MALRRHQLSQRRKAVGFSQESFAEHLGVERSTVVRWEAGDNEPLPWVRPKIARALQVSIDQLAELLTSFENSTPSVDTPLMNRGAGYEKEIANEMNRRNMPETVGVGTASLSPLGDLRDVVLDAARNSALLRASIEIPGISGHALSQVRGQLYQLATDYALTSDLDPILRALVVLRDRLYTAATTRQHHPSDTRDLYALLGAACVLLASVSHDLSEPHAGLTQAAAAETFAELSGDRALLTWVYCTKAMIASWSGTPHDVLGHVDKARAQGVVGISAIRLAGLEARALAQLGKHTEAIAVLCASEDQRATVGEYDKLRELGEVFTFPVARQHYYNAATHLHLKNWADVEHETSKVIDLYGTPTVGKPWPVTLTLSRIYQAQARLQVHGPDGVRDALQPVFNIPDKQRLHQTSQALDALRGNLQTPLFATLPAARDLSDAIVFFQSSTATR